MPVSEKKRVVVEGQPGPLMHELLRQDKHPVSEALLDDQNDYIADTESDHVDKNRYLSRDFYDREVDLLWGRTWQIACREEQIPKVGDYVVYEIADKSLIMVRTAEDEIKAFYNACPHRGRTLCDDAAGHVANFRCKFHGMMWRLDGRLGHIPSRWDFPHVEDEKFGLPQAKVARWQGFVFINMDPDSIAFEDFIQDLGELTKGCDYENRYIAAHVGLVIPVNWKVLLEAFIEDYHHVATHPQVLPFLNSQSAMYTVRKDKPHFSRMLFALGVKSPYLPDVSEERTFEVMKESQALPGEDWTFRPGESARAQIAEIFRKRLGGAGAEIPDTDLLDAWMYFVFPNIVLWAGHGNIIMRYRPWNNDHRQSMMEYIVMLPVPKGEPRPAAARFNLLPLGSKFSDAPELGAVGSFLDQDLSNMAEVQKGLHSLTGPGPTFAKYQESEIRHFNHVLDRYLNGERPKGG